MKAAHRYAGAAFNIVGRHGRHGRQQKYNRRKDTELTKNYYLCHRYNVYTKIKHIKNSLWHTNA